MHNLSNRRRNITGIALLLPLSLAIAACGDKAATTDDTVTTVDDGTAAGGTAMDSTGTGMDGSMDSQMPPAGSPPMDGGMAPPATIEPNTTDPMGTPMTPGTTGTGTGSTNTDTGSQPN
ncbi:hypothetical protein [Polymorphobacter sp.]|uniref:hypothetical protein n=1 Tax=Polymorphobacter sp. TaxID=1909290 RepID=UPI003F700316